MKWPRSASDVHLALADGLRASIVQELKIPCAPPWIGESPWLSDDPEIRKRAAESCFDCPVLDECREAGSKEHFGVWGGKDRTPIPRVPHETNSSDQSDNNNQEN